MERLPEDIIIIIASLLPSDGLAPFATLSRLWQQAIERRTFSSLRVDSTDEELGVFSRTVWVSDTRRRFLCYLAFAVVLESDERTVKPSQQWQRFSESMTWDLHQLFRILAESDDENEMTLQLGYVRSRRDGLHDKDPRYLRPRLALLGNIDHFPIVKCVANLVLCIDTSTRRVALRTAVDLAKRLPCLRCIDIVAEEVEMCQANKKAEAVHREDRHGLADALVEANFLSDTGCREVSLSLEQHDPVELQIMRRWTAPDSTNSLSYDPLGAAMRAWSYNLVRLEIGGVFDGSLFWPSESEQSEIPISPWPRLKEFRAKLGMTTPAGGWYFMEQPDIHRRNIPCEDTMQPLFAAWAKALESMPVLEQAAIHFQVIGGSDDFDIDINNWSVILQAPDTNVDLIPHPWVEKLRSESRLIFGNTGGWRPEKPVMRKLQAMFKDRFPSRKMAMLEINAENPLAKYLP
ncbi:hypothetical protein F4814DRAFT_450856 [Daldinia grandis]|nr:hypothetical protein F4814DRAFT_450856 [Daldinia grandis]